MAEQQRKILIVGVRAERSDFHDAANRPVRYECLNMKIHCLVVMTLLVSGYASRALAADPSSPSVPPFVGHRYTLHYAAGQAFLFEFKSATSAQFTYLEGPSKGKHQTVTFATKEVGDSVYMLYWQEADKTTVVHVDDFKTMQDYTNITLADHRFLNLHSPITSADGADAVPATIQHGTDQEQLNKQVVTSFYEAGLNIKDFDAARAFLGDSYKQHNPNAADGVEGFRGFVTYLKQHLPNSHSEITQVFADGDFVILHVHKTTGPDDRGVAIMDIFRLENRKIVEHWDVSQAVPERTVSGNSMF